jgi:phage terminase small subunit
METTTKPITNPNGANGTTSDPREQVMWDIYVARMAKGIENATQSAIDAGYSEDHARNITLQGWFKERKNRLRRKEMLTKAERNLDKVLDFDMITDEGKVNTPVASLVTNVSTTIVKTLGKEDYSERIEQTGKDGKDLIPETLTQEEKESLLSLIK